MSTYFERELQRSSVGIDASGGNTVYRVSPPRAAVPFSTTEYVRIDTTRNQLVVADGESFSEPLLAQGDSITVFCDGAHNWVRRLRVSHRESWSSSPDTHEGVRVLSRWASNRYDGSTQDWVATSTGGTGFVASPTGVAVRIPGWTLRDYGYIEWTFTGLLTGDNTNAQTARFGFLRNDLDNTTNAGATAFAGGASIDSLAISAGITPAAAWPFRYRIRMHPVPSEGSTTPGILCIAKLWSTIANGSPGASDSSTSLLFSADSGGTAFDSTIDNKVVPVFRRTGTAASTVTWDIRSMTVLHFAERRF